MLAPSARALPPLAQLCTGHGDVDQAFLPADRAAELAMSRRDDAELVARVRAFAGDAMLPLGDRPVFVLIRAIPSADHELLRFLELCRAVDARPLIVTMLTDRFTNLNHDKFRRARMQFWWPGRTRTLRAGDLRGADGARMCDLRTRRGRSLAAYHRQLLDTAHPGIDVVDRCDWLRPHGRSDYLHFFALTMVGAVLVEAMDCDPAEQQFFAERVMPAWHQASEMFGAVPLMTSHFAPAEIPDDFWWGYPGAHFDLAARLLYEPGDLGA